jgi:lipopolysaccharide transport protein LptA
MAGSPGKCSVRPHLSRACLIIVTVLLACAANAAELLSRKLPLTVDAASSEVDYKSNRIILRDVALSQGDITVTAQRAEAAGGLDTENSRWTLTGNVRIKINQRGNLSSDRAVVAFKNKRIDTATVTGNPAEFEQHEAGSDQVAHGHAREIEYAVNAGTIRLKQDAWVSSAGREITGPLLVYNIREQHLEAVSSPDTGERVHIVITPPGDKTPDGPK